MFTRGSGEAPAKLMRRRGSCVRGIRRCSREAPARLRRGSGEARARLWRGSGDVHARLSGGDPARLTRGSGEDPAIFTRGSGDSPPGIRRGSREAPAIHAQTLPRHLILIGSFQFLMSLTQHTMDRQYFTKEVAISAVLSRLMSGKLSLDPPYLRKQAMKSDWNQEMKSRIIDIIRNRMPIVVTFRELGDKFECVKGQNKLNAIQEYCDDKWPHRLQFFFELSEEDRKAFIEHTIIAIHFIGPGWTDDISGTIP